MMDKVQSKKKLGPLKTNQGLSQRAMRQSQSQENTRLASLESQNKSSDLNQNGMFHSFNAPLKKAGKLAPLPQGSRSVPKDLNTVQSQKQIPKRHGLLNDNLSKERKAAATPKALKPPLNLAPSKMQDSTLKLPQPKQKLSKLEKQSKKKKLKGTNDEAVKIIKKKSFKEALQGEIDDLDELIDRTISNQSNKFMKSLQISGSPEPIHDIEQQLTFDPQNAEQQNHNDSVLDLQFEEQKIQFRTDQHNRDQNGRRQTAQFSASPATVPQTGQLELSQGGSNIVIVNQNPRQPLPPEEQKVDTQSPVNSFDDMQFSEEIKLEPTMGKKKYKVQKKSNDKIEIKPGPKVNVFSREAPQAPLRLPLSPQINAERQEKLTASLEVVKQIHNSPIINTDKSKKQSSQNLNLNTETRSPKQSGEQKSNSLGDESSLKIQNPTTENWMKEGREPHKTMMKSDKSIINHMDSFNHSNQFDKNSTSIKMPSLMYTSGKSQVFNQRSQNVIKESIQEADDKSPFILNQQLGRPRVSSTQVKGALSIPKNQLSILQQKISQLQFSNSDSYAKGGESPANKAQGANQNRRMSKIQVKGDQMLSACKQSLEFIIIAFCKSFGFTHPRDAARFVSEGPSSDADSTESNTYYACSLQEVENFSKITQFLSLLQTNLKNFIAILEAEHTKFMLQSQAENSSNSPSTTKGKENSNLQIETTSHYIVMNILALGLSKSVDERIVWQTCNLMSGIFQSVNSVKINQNFQTFMTQWALHQDYQGQFKGCLKDDFINSCLTARKSHLDLNNVIVGLFCEVSNLGRSKRIWEPSKESSQLVELFYNILPQYFSDQNKHEYYELMDEVLEMDHFQFQKERVDKQLLLYLMIDSCFLELSSSQTSTSSLQLCMSILCQIWQSNHLIFRQPIQAFVLNFKHSLSQSDIALKATQPQLKFNFLGQEPQTKIGKIALQLLKKKVNSQSQLVQQSVIVKIFHLLEMFQNRGDKDLVQVIFKLICSKVVQVFESGEEMLGREMLCMEVACFFKRWHEFGEISILVSKLHEFSQSLYNQKVQPLYQQVDDGMMVSLIEHPKLTMNNNNKNIEKLYFVFSSKILETSCRDHNSMQLCKNWLTKLFQRFEHELTQQIQSFVRLGSQALINIEKDLGQGTLGQDQKEDLLLRRHVLCQAIGSIITASQKHVSDPDSVVAFAAKTFQSIEQQNEICGTIRTLQDIVQIKVQELEKIAPGEDLTPKSGPQLSPSKTSLLEFKKAKVQQNKKDKIASPGPASKENTPLGNINLPSSDFTQAVARLKLNMMKVSEPSTPKAIKKLKGKVQDPRPTPIKLVQQNSSPQLVKALNMGELKHSLEQLAATQRSKVSTKRRTRMSKSTVTQRNIKSTHRFLQASDSGAMINDRDIDLNDQSECTTLRTEIYTSEDEYEMVNYYAFLSDYKKEIKVNGTKKSAEQQKEKPEPQQIFKEGTFVKCKKPTMYLNDSKSNSMSSKSSEKLMHASIIEPVSINKSLVSTNKNDNLNQPATENLNSPLPKIMRTKSQLDSSFRKNESQHSSGKSPAEIKRKSPRILSNEFQVKEVSPENTPTSPINKVQPNQDTFIFKPNIVNKPLESSTKLIDLKQVQNDDKLFNSFKMDSAERTPKLNDQIFSSVIKKQTPKVKTSMKRSKSSNKTSNSSNNQYSFQGSHMKKIKNFKISQMGEVSLRQSPDKKRSPPKRFRQAEDNTPRTAKFRKSDRGHESPMSFTKSPNASKRDLFNVSFSAKVKEVQKSKDYQVRQQIAKTRKKSTRRDDPQTPKLPKKRIQKTTIPKLVQKQEQIVQEIIKPQPIKIKKRNQNNQRIRTLIPKTLNESSGSIMKSQRGFNQKSPVDKKNEPFSKQLYSSRFLNNQSPTKWTVSKDQPQVSKALLKVASAPKLPYCKKIRVEKVESVVKKSSKVLKIAKVSAHEKQMQDLLKLQENLSNQLQILRKFNSKTQTPKARRDDVLNQNQSGYTKRHERASSDLTGKNKKPPRQPRNSTSGDQKPPRLPKRPTPEKQLPPQQVVIHQSPQYIHPFVVPQGQQHLSQSYGPQQLVLTNPYGMMQPPFQSPITVYQNDHISPSNRQVSSMSPSTNFVQSPAYTMMVQPPMNDSVNSILPQTFNQNTNQIQPQQPQQVPSLVDPIQMQVQNPVQDQQAPQIQQPKANEANQRDPKEQAKRSIKLPSSKQISPTLRATSPADPIEEVENSEQHSFDFEEYKKIEIDSLATSQIPSSARLITNVPENTQKDLPKMKIAIEKPHQNLDVPVLPHSNQNQDENLLRPSRQVSQRLSERSGASKTMKNNEIPAGTLNQAIQDQLNTKPPVETPYRRQRSKFQQILDEQEKSRGDTSNQLTYARQLSHSALQEKKKLRKEFNEAIQKTDISPVQIKLMSQKTMERIQELKKQRSTVSRASKLSSEGKFSRQFTQKTITKLKAFDQASSNEGSQKNSSPGLRCESKGAKYLQAQNSEQISPQLRGSPPLQDPQNSISEF